MQAIFLRHEGFLGALGALTSYENLDADDLTLEDTDEQVKLVNHLDLFTYKIASRLIIKIFSEWKVMFILSFCILYIFGWWSNFKATLLVYSFRRRQSAWMEDVTQGGLNPLIMTNWNTCWLGVLSCWNNQQLHGRLLINPCVKSHQNLEYLRWLGQHLVSYLLPIWQEL